MFTSIRFAAVAFAFALAGPAVGATGDVQVTTAPGEAAATVIVKGSGTIKAIDAKTRTVTILGDGGTEVEFVAGPEVKNFAQLAVGQRVNTEYMKGLTLELKPGSTAPISRTVEPFGDTGKKGQPARRRGRPTHPGRRGSDVGESGDEDGDVENTRAQRPARTQRSRADCTDQGRRPRGSRLYRSDRDLGERGEVASKSGIETR